MSISTNEWWFDGRNLKLDISEGVADLANADMVAGNEQDFKRVCPHCGASYYMERHRAITCVYYPPIYKDGVNINPDRNEATVYCTCMNCHKEFEYVE